jgi:hypothetical protein
MVNARVDGMVCEDTSSSPGSTAVTSSSSAPHVYIHGRNRIRYSATAPTTAIKPASHGRCCPYAETRNDAHLHEGSKVLAMMTETP